jgi:hypothetical protein
MGEVQQCAYDIWLDGHTITGSPQDDKLFEKDGLDGTLHRLVVTTHLPAGKDGSLSFYGVEYGYPTTSM